MPLKQTCMLNTWRVWLTQSTQSVKVIVHLRKRSHNWLMSALKWFCTKVRKYWRCSIKQQLVSWSSPVVPSYGSKPKHWWRIRVKNGWRRGDPNLSCMYPKLLQLLCVHLQHRHLRKANIKNKLSNLLPKIIHTIVSFSYVFWDWGREVFKLIWVALKRVCIPRSSYAIVNGWSLFSNPLV